MLSHLENKHVVTYVCQRCGDLCGLPYQKRKKQLIFCNRWTMLCLKEKKKKKTFPSLPPPPTSQPPLLSLLSSSSSSCHHICFSSCNILVSPKRILTCGFDELTHSHTLSLCSFFFSFAASFCSLFLNLFFPLQTKMLPTAETCEGACTNTTHLLLSFIGFPLSFALSRKMSHDHVFSLYWLFMSFPVKSASLFL